MASRTEGDKLPYVWCWTLAMVHIGTYPCVNISQQLKPPVHTVSAAESVHYCILTALLFMQNDCPNKC